MALKEETETVITWTLADEYATVYSLMPKVWRWCERCGGKQIRQDEGIRGGKKLARTYLVLPALIRIRPGRTLTQAQRDATKARLQGAKQAKSGSPDA